MRYTLRPAWRSQFGLMLVAAALFALSLIPVLESFSTNATNSFFGAISLAFGVPLIVVVLMMLYRHYSSRYLIADGNIESSRGIIAREISSIQVEDVRNINVRQSILQRLLGYGDVEFSSAASAEAEVVFDDVANPIWVKEKVQSLL
jgi:uncharacterized membrane protein YdbT with pleckstrin-like domain